MHIFYPTAQESWNHNLSNVAMMTQFPASGVANEKVFITEIQKNVLVPFRNFYLPMVLVITAVVALTNFNTPLTRSTDVELRGGGRKRSARSTSLNWSRMSVSTELATKNMVALPEPLPFWHHCQHLPAIHLVGFLRQRGCLCEVC